MYVCWLSLPRYLDCVVLHETDLAIEGSIKSTTTRHCASAKLKAWLGEKAGSDRG
jgi:hypothetical protein